MVRVLRGVIFFVTLLMTAVGLAKKPEYVIELKQHLFYPAVIEIPAHQKVKLIIINYDNTPEEFDSFELNREKVIFPNSRAVIFVGPLPPGEYPFFGEYNPNTAKGKVIVKKLSELGAQVNHVN